MTEPDRLLAGRYRLRRYLGGGAMGVVWQADDERLHRVVAVKQLLSSPSLDPESANEARQRAMREGRLAARLHHPNAIAIHDVAEEDGLPVLVMEYLPSRSLETVLAEEGPLSVEQVSHIGARAATALEAAHAVGIIHRDVKPGNILLGEDAMVKITDFGISRAADDVSVTRTGVLAGTPAYLAPEVARGDDPLPASDVFSLGSTLYAAVEGQPPFGDSDNSIALLHTVAHGDFAPPQQAGKLTALLMRMLRAEPGERPDMAEAARALRALADGHHAEHQAGSGARDVATVAEPEATRRVSARQGSGQASRRGPSGTQVGHASVSGGADEARRPPRRSRLLYGLVALFLLMLVAGGLAFGKFLPSGNTGRAHPPAPSGPELERAVSDYYALLPDHPENAWPRLGSGLRRDSAGYTRFWNTVSDVTVIAAPRATSPSSVLVGIELTKRDGSSVREFHSLGMLNQGGEPLVNSDSVLHTQHIPPKTTPSPSRSHEEDREKQREKEEQSDEKGREKKKEKDNNN